MLTCIPIKKYIKTYGFYLEKIYNDFDVSSSKIHTFVLSEASTKSTFTFRKSSTIADDYFLEYSQHLAFNHVV